MHQIWENILYLLQKEQFGIDKNKTYATVEKHELTANWVTLKEFSTNYLILENP